MTDAMDERVVQTLYGDLLDAWNRRNARDYAALFWDDGFVVGFDGSSHDDPERIESDLGQIFGNHPTAAYVGKVRSVRFLNADVGVLRAVAGMVRPGESDLFPPANAIQTLIAARRDGEWRISVFQNTPAAFHGSPELADQLTAELRAELRGERGAPGELDGRIRVRTYRTLP